LNDIFLKWLASIKVRQKLEYNMYIGLIYAREAV